MTPLALLPGERLEVEFETYYGLNQTAERDKERTEITVQCFSKKGSTKVSFVIPTIAQIFMLARSTRGW